MAFQGPTSSTAPQANGLASRPVHGYAAGVRSPHVARPHGATRVAGAVPVGAAFKVRAEALINSGRFLEKARALSRLSATIAPCPRAAIKVFVGGSSVTTPITEATVETATSPQSVISSVVLTATVTFKVLSDDILRYLVTTFLHKVTSNLCHICTLCINRKHSKWTI